MVKSQPRARVRETMEDRITLGVFYVLLTLIALMTIYPVLYVISASVSEPTAVNDGSVVLWPVGFQLEGYQYIFENDWILLGYRNSLIYTVAGTLLDIAVTFLAAYALSRRDIFGRRALNTYMIIPMWFSGGLIPTFMMINSMGLVDQWYTLIIIGAFNTYNFVICRTFIQSNIPLELQEAARIDGCSDLGIMAKVVLPLSKPVLAILCLYYGLAHWNDYFTGLIYINTRSLQPLQLFLREILIQNAQLEMGSGDMMALEDSMRRVYMMQVMRYGLIVVSSVPMLILYPFVQKYFVQGVMIGALKG
ncbi:MAG TPA: carbohydrate ABC transporter permease [Candidatus Faecaligallichristensenella faecipullorum]|nr:carbohydrate ABC transporter permease [Candidatus Faecaligallichristensenella faecipullorum]